MLENKSELNKVNVSLLHKKKIEKEIFLDTTQLDYRTVPWPGQYLCFHKSQRRNLSAYINIYDDGAVLEIYLDHKFR